MRAPGRMLALTIAALGAFAAPAAAQLQVPARTQTTSLDSEAPKGAPPHWLPGKTWVMMHWLPYDEQRLYALLGADRGTIWRQLRDDTRNLAQLAEQRGWEPSALARELVAPWRAQLRDPARLALLERRALLHADAGPHGTAHVLPLAAPGGDPVARGGDLRRRQPRGVVGAAALRAQPAADLPPQRAPARARAGAGDRDAARGGGARGGAPGDAGGAGRAAALAPAAPAPALAAADALQRAAAAALAAVLAGDGVELLQQRGGVGRRPRDRLRELPGEARDRQAPRRDRGDGARAPALPPPCWRAARRPTRAPTTTPPCRPTGAGSRSSPRSATSTSPSATGACRCSRATCAAAARSRSRHPPDLTISRSAYNPTISGDGRLVAYEAYDRPDEPSGGTRIVVHDLRSGRERAVPVEGASEPRLSADGRWLAYSALLATRGRVESSSATCAAGARVQVSGAARGGVGAGAVRARRRRRLHRRGRRRRVARGGPDPRAARARRSPRRPAPASPSSRRCPQRPPCRVRRAAGRHAPDAGLRPRPAPRGARSSSRAPTGATARPAWAARATPRSRATAAASRSPPTPGT